MTTKLFLLFHIFVLILRLFYGDMQISTELNNIHTETEYALFFPAILCYNKNIHFGQVGFA